MQYRFRRFLPCCFSIPIFLRVSGICLSGCCFLQSVFAQLPAGFIRERIADGLNPTSMVMAPDGRIFITEKNGVIRIIRDDQLISEPFLSLEVDDSNERGLGHLVFHPDFDHNGYCYVFYAVPGQKHNRISRFTAQGDKGIPGSERIIMDLDELGSDIHNGGDMVFGFDGNLYVATGDGGQNWRGEDLGSTNGKILRMDDEGNAVPDNPWYTLDYLRAPFVYAYGLRNPFTITQHPLTGEIYANDVGHSKFEEINRIEKGAFYGWPRVEGKRTNEDVPPEYKDPFYAYAHADQYCCIVGSAIYAPAFMQFPGTYAGKYFYSDYCTGHMHVLNLESGQDEGLFITDGDRVIDIDVDMDGNLYYLERKGKGDGSQEDNTATDEGMVWKVRYTGSGAPFISIPPASLLVSAGEDALFTVSATGQLPLSFTWYVDDVLAQEGESSSFRITATSVDLDSSLVSVDIRNAQGSVLSEKALLRVTTNHRPRPDIVDPSVQLTYAGGTAIYFSGTGHDDEDGFLPDSALSWRVDFHHGTHTHPALSWVKGIRQGSFAIPSAGETSGDVWYRFYLRVTDGEGLSGITHRDIYPRLGKIKVNTFPPGLTVRLDGTPAGTPFDVNGVQGINRYLSPPQKQIRGDSIYFFQSWLDGSVEENREVKTGAMDQHFTALFEGKAKGKGSGLTATYYANMDFADPPWLTRLDSVVDVNFLSGGPLPGMPGDHFSIQWDGYLQPVRSGTYRLTVFSDDGASLEWNGMTLFQNWEFGFHNQSAQVYMDSSRLYPIRLRMQENQFGAQVRLRWSCADFDEETIPSFQLYPSDYLSRPRASGIVSVASITDDALYLRTESYIESVLDLRITDAAGHVWHTARQYLPAAKNELSIPIGFLPAGLYYLTGYRADGGQSFTSPFIKAR